MKVDNSFHAIIAYVLAPKWLVCSILVAQYAFQQIACKDDLKKCVGSASGLAAKAQCFKAFAKCLKNKGTDAVVLDAIEDVGQMADVNGFLVSTK